MIKILRLMLQEHTDLKLNIGCKNVEVEAGIYLIDDTEWSYIKIIAGGDSVYDLQIPTRHLSDAILEEAAKIIEP